MRLSNCNAHQVLITCFKRFTAYRGATQVYGNVQSSTVDSRLERLCDDKIASAVVGYVDRMDKVSKAYCYFCFSPDHDWDQYSHLVNIIHDRFIEKNPDMRKERLVYAARLSLLAPQEYRYRLTNPAKTKHSWEELASILGMQRVNFRGAGAQVWKGLLDEMADIAIKADNEIIIFVRKINHLDDKNTKSK